MTQSTRSFQFKIATLNVLHALVPPSWPIIQPTRRYKKIASIMRESTADVFCLNECTQFFLDVVEPLVHDVYPHSTQLIIRSRKHAVKIYSKLPLQEVYTADSLAIARVDISATESVIVVATHLSHDQRQMNKRSRQIQEIRTKLTNLVHDESISIRTRRTLSANRVILLGDLNLHLRGETALLLRNGFLDCWLEDHEQQPGYTWDPQVNPMINMVLPFDNRRMRLDRIAVSNGSDLKTDSIRIFANEKMEESWYLYPSDHFGLEATFSLLSAPVTRPIDQSQLESLERQNTTGFRTVQTIIGMRFGLVGILALGLLLLLI